MISSFYCQIQQSLCFLVYFILLLNMFLPALVAVIWIQDVIWMYIRRSEDVLDVLWMSYVLLFYALCSGCVYLLCNMYDFVKVGGLLQTNLVNKAGHQQPISSQYIIIVMSRRLDTTGFQFLMQMEKVRYRGVTR